MPGNFSGGSFSGAVGGFSVDGGAAVVTATPGRIRQHLGRAQFRVEDEAEKLARRIREGTVAAPPVPRQPFAPSEEYIRKSATLAAGIARLRDESERHREAIASLEKAQDKAREVEKVRRGLLRAQQALQLAMVQEAVLIEEMEVLDVSFLAQTAVWMTLH